MRAMFVLMLLGVKINTSFLNYTKKFNNDDDAHPEI